jgi:FkbM family methyltransferase
MSAPVLFPMEGNVTIRVPMDHPFSREFAGRPPHEWGMRLLVATLYKAGVLDAQKGVLDAGAWIGDNAAPWATMIQGPVLAVDPSEENCRYIQQLAIMNRLPNLQIQCFALSDQHEVLSTPNDIRHCSFIYHKLEGTHEGQPTTEARAVPLDILAGLIAPTPFELIHLDVEGMEYKALLGASEILRIQRPVVIYEVHLTRDSSIPQIESLFKDLNYRVFCIEETLLNCRTDCRNCIAVPVERMEKFEPVRVAFGVLGIPLLARDGRDAH